MHLAAKNGHSEVVEILLKQWEEINDLNQVRTQITEGSKVRDLKKTKQNKKNNHKLHFKGIFFFSTEWTSLVLLLS